MNKFGIFIALVCAFVAVSADTCDVPSDEHFQNIEFIDMKDNCTRLTEEQIKKEITASLKYLSYAAFFSQDDINRPGFANFFFGAASEEREHAEKLIEYLSMRGRYFDSTESKIATINIGNLIKNSENAELLGLKGALYMPHEHSAEKSAGLKALKAALSMEMAVTKSIRVLIAACEAENVVKDGNTDVFNDYHFVDYLTGEFLTEQYHGKRDIAGKISTLGKMIDANGAELADFLFDKKLQ